MDVESPFFSCFPFSDLVILHPGADAAPTFADGATNAGEDDAHSMSSLQTPRKANSQARMVASPGSNASCKSGSSAVSKFGNPLRQKGMHLDSLKQMVASGSAQTGRPDSAPVLSINHRGVKLADAADMDDVGSDPSTKESSSAETTEGLEQLDELVDVPVNPFSVDEDFPKGGVFVPLSRIRATLNAYADKVSKPRWYEDFKMPTLQGLLRRLRAYEGQVDSRHNMDHELAYKQCCARLSSLLLLYKCLCAWWDSKDSKMLINIIQPLHILNDYLAYTSQELAPDLKMLQLSAVFVDKLEVTKSVQRAMDVIDPAVLQSWCAAMGVAGGATAAGASAASAVVKEEEPPHEAAALDTQEAACKPNKRRPKNKLLDMGGRFITVGACGFATKLVVDGLKRLIYPTTADIVNHPEDLENLIDDITGAANCFKTKFGGLEGSAQTSDVLEAVSNIWRCGLATESERPDANTIRSARGTILSGAKTMTTLGDLCKTMLGYAGGTKEVMARAKEVAALGLEDEASDARWSLAADRFEASLGPAFDDIQGWAAQGNEGTLQDYASMTTVLSCMDVFLSTAEMCVGRWSSRALQEKTDELADTVGNLSWLLKVGNDVLLVRTQAQLIPDILHAAPADTVPAAAEQPAGTEEEAPGDSTRGDVKNEPDDESQLLEHEDEAPQHLRPAGTRYLARIEEVWQIRPLWAAVSGFGERLLDTAKSLVNLSSNLERRLSKDAWQAQLGDDPAAIWSQISANYNTLETMSSYLMKWVYLAEQEGVAYSGPPPLVNLMPGGAYIVAMSEFSKIHYDHLQPGDTEPAGVATTMSLGGLDCRIVNVTDAADGIAMAFFEFMSKEGEELFASHVKTAISTWTGEIHHGRVTTSTVHADTLAKGASSELIPLLIVAPSWQRLLPSKETFKDGRLSLDGSDADFDIFSGTYERKAFGLLSEFCGCVPFKTLPIPCADQAIGAKKVAEVPTQAALLWLETLCVMREISVCASILHATLLKPSTDQHVIDRDLLFGYICFAQRCAHTFITKLDTILHKPDVKDFEMQGFSGCAFEASRRWLEQMSKVSGRAGNEWIRQAARILSRDSADCKKALPTMEACFEGEAQSFSEEIALSLCHKKLPTIVCHHNKVHDTLSRMNNCAMLLNVFPTLVNNELSKSEVAVAKATMMQAATAASFTLGVTSLNEFRSDPDGSAKATEFLAKHRTEHTKSLPPAFWAEFEAVVQHASLPSMVAAKLEQEDAASHVAVKIEQGKAHGDGDGQKEVSRMSQASSCKAQATSSTAVPPSPGRTATSSEPIMKRRRRQ